MAADGNDHRLRRHEYMKRVLAEFSNQPEVLEQLSEIMSDHFAHEIDVNETVRLVHNLLGREDLQLRFYQLFPPGFQMETSKFGDETLLNPTRSVSHDSSRAPFGSNSALFKLETGLEENIVTAFFSRYPCDYCMTPASMRLNQFLIEVQTTSQDPNFRGAFLQDNQMSCSALEHILRVRNVAETYLTDQALWPLLIFHTLNPSDRKLWLASNNEYKRRLFAVLDVTYANNHPNVEASVPDWDHMQMHFLVVFDERRIGSAHVVESSSLNMNVHNMIPRHSRISGSHSDPTRPRPTNTLSFRVRHWSTIFDEQYLYCDASVLFETVRFQFDLDPTEDMAIYYFPPGPPRPSGAPNRIKLSYERMAEIVRIGHLVHMPCLYLHTLKDNIDLPNFEEPRRCSPPEKNLPNDGVFSPSRGVHSPDPVNANPSPPLSDEVRTARNVPAALKRMVAANNNWLCYRCNIRLPATYEIDHIVPSVDGGYDNSLENLQALCPSCHKSKSMLEFHQFNNAAARTANAEICCTCSKKSQCRTQQCKCQTLDRNCSSNCACGDVCSRRSVSGRE